MLEPGVDPSVPCDGLLWKRQWTFRFY